MTHFIFCFSNNESRCSLLNDEGTDPFPLLSVLFSDGPCDRDSRSFSTRDQGFASIENIVIFLANGCCSNIRRIRSCMGFCNSERASGVLTVTKVWNVLPFYLLLSKLIYDLSDHIGYRSGDGMRGTSFCNLCNGK